MKPVKTHKTDPQPVIEYARVWASETEERKYVRVFAKHFAAVALQPPAHESHWMVLPDGECSAHIEVNQDGRYKYETSER